MGNKIFPILFIVIFFLAVTPLVLLYPSGSARIGLSIGFMHILNQPIHLTIIVLIGLAGSTLRHDALLMLPISFLLMFTIGSFTMIDAHTYPLREQFLLGAILLFGFTVNVCQSKHFFMIAVFSSTIAFQLGSHYMAQFHSDVPQLHFLLGELFLIALLLCASSSLGYAIRGEIPRINTDNHA
jgi:hydrogenase/urease accessory protein HupE